MRFLRLSDEQSEQLAETPEHLPNIIFVKCSSISDEPFVVVNEQILISPTEHHRNSDNLMRNSLGSALFAQGSREENLKVLDKWRQGLETAPEIELLKLEPDELTRLLFSLSVPPGIALPPVAGPYGHLPLMGTTGKTEVFYRCEVFAKSFRIDQTGSKIRGGTYAFPASDLAFVPTGLAAVGRYSLPLLFPAVYRWELQPVAGAAIRCGACVPAFGQSGGGVEVFFNALTTNRGPIANPVKLPVL